MCQTQEERSSIFNIITLPEAMATILRKDYNMSDDTVRSILFCFDKQVFLPTTRNLFWPFM